MVKPVDAAQSAFDFGESPEKQDKRKVGPSEFDEVLRREEKSRDKAKEAKAEADYFKDQRTPRSELIQKAEMEKIRELMDKKPIKTSSQSSMLSPQGNVTAAGRGGSGGGGGGGGGMGTGKMNRDITKNYKSGGSVKKSASSRADGCAIRGKTRA